MEIEIVCKLSGQQLDLPVEYLKFPLIKICLRLLASRSNARSAVKVEVAPFKSREITNLVTSSKCKLLQRARDR